MNAMCKFLLSDQSIELETRNLIMLVEPNAKGMHQQHAQDAIAQMPQIARPHAFELASIGELPKDRINQIANTTQDRTLVGRCTRRSEERRVGKSVDLGGRR